MTSLLLGILTTCSMVTAPHDCAPAPIHGSLSQYAPGVMEATIAARQDWGQLPYDLSGFAGAIAVLDCDRIGETAYLSIDGGEWLPVIIADCSGHAHTTAWMREAGILGEVNYGLAERFGFVGRGIGASIRYLN